MSAYARIGEAAGDAMLDAGAALSRKKPSGVRLSGSMKRRSRSSTSEVMSRADSASVRAMMQGRHAADIGGEARGGEAAAMLGGRDQHLAAEMAAFLFGGQLVLEMDAGGAGVDHRPS